MSSRELFPPDLMKYEENLLTKEEEYSLIKAIKAGSAALNEINSNGNKSEIREVVETGNTAWGVLVSRNMGYLVDLALKRRNPGDPIFKDLIQEGAFGIRHAAINFNLNSGNRFLTYATSWITRYMNRYLNKNRHSIVYPEWIPDRLRIIKRIEDKYYKTNGVLPDIDYIVEKMPKYTNPSKEKVKFLKQLDLTKVSLNLIRDEDSDEIQEILADELLNEDFDMGLLSQRLAKLLEKLKEYNPRMHAIVAARHGLDGEPPRTQVRVGMEFNLSGERIRKIENEAYGLMYCWLNKDRDYLDFLD